MPGRGGEDDQNLIVNALDAHMGMGGVDVAHSLRAEGFDASEDGTGRGTPLISVCLGSDPISALDMAMPQTTRNGDPGVISGRMGVRRLTPTECLRLQAFPDDWLDLDPPLSDSAKYRMCGNAVTVNVIEWMGRRMGAAQ
jgi:DNA (cytosine-5)-methyltransferase 1